MGSTRRTVLTTKHKAVLWFLGLLFLWEVLQSNAVLEAFLTFGFAGVVPGTNIVLSPDGVILVTGITLALLFIAIILRLLLKRPKERIPASLGLAAEALADAPAIEATETLAPAPVVSHHAPSSKAPGFLARSTKKLRLLSVSMRRRATRIIGIALEWLDVKMPVVVRALHRLSQIVWAVGMITFVFIRKWAISTIRYAKRQIVALLQWLVPYLWKFDTWLELRVRVFTKWARYKSRQYHSLTVLISMYRQYKKLYSDSPITTFFKTLRRPASRPEDEV